MDRDGGPDGHGENPGAGRQPLGAAFWTLWTASGLSNLADGVLKIALPLIALRYTDSPTLLAGLAVALSLPWLLFALPAGALADRSDRRRIMVAANAVRAGLLGALVLALLTGADPLVALYLVAFGIGCSETAYDTSAQAILPQVVPRPALSRANGRLLAAELTANQFIGPPLGGALVAVGAGLSLAVPAALWVCAAGALLFVRGSFRVERPGRSTLRADIAEGLRFLWSRPLLRTLAVMVGGFNFASNAAFAVFVLFAVGEGSAMELTEPGFGLLLTSIAAGSVLGSLVAEGIEQRFGRSRSLALAILASVPLVAAPAVTAEPWLVGPAFFLGGAAIAVWNVISVSLRQRITPDRLLGRVNSAYRLLAWGTMPVGAAAGGLLARYFGLTTVFAVMGIVTFALLLGMRTVTEPAIQAAAQFEDQFLDHGAAGVGEPLGLADALETPPLEDLDGAEVVHYGAGPKRAVGDLGQELAHRRRRDALPPAGLVHPVADLRCLLVLVREDAADNFPVGEDGAHRDLRVVEEVLPVVVEDAAVGGVLRSEGGHMVRAGVQLVLEELVEVGGFNGADLNHSGTFG
jgi:MFS family permease